MQSLHSLPKHLCRPLLTQTAKWIKTLYFESERLESTHVFGTARLWTTYAIPTRRSPWRLHRYFWTLDASHIPELTPDPCDQKTKGHKILGPQILNPKPKPEPQDSTPQALKTWNPQTQNPVPGTRNPTI